MTLSALDENEPRAFLSYLLFDNNLKFVDFGFDQVSEGAVIGSEETRHELLERNDIKIEKGGYIYIYVSNESDQDMDVYFDDLKITHEYGDIVAGGDYYPFGLAMDTREVTREDYRYGYQRQFSEMDDETGWNHFELRQYDARIGRFNAIDPAGQFYSSYLAMGNNPVIGVDPDGGFCDTCPGYEEGVSNSDILLDEIVITPGGSSFDIGWNQWDYNGSFSQWQQLYGTQGLTYDQEMFIYDLFHRDAFFENWNAAVQRERDQMNIAKMARFVDGVSTAGSMGMGAFGSSISSVSPKTFSFTPRGYNPPKLNYTQQQAWTKFGRHYKEYRLKHGPEGLKQYMQIADDVYRNPTITRTFSSSSNFFRGETWRIFNGNILRTDASGNFRSMYRIIK